jgi:hypothetical protein
MDLVKLLNDHKATAQDSIAKLGENDFLRGYILAIDHAIGLATIQAIRLEWNLPVGPQPEEQRLACGCLGECDPYAHDTAPDWDGRPDGPDYTRCPECDGKIYEGETCKECTR